MKKVLVILILFLTVISVDVVNASSPIKLKNYSSSSTLKQGETVVVDTKVIYGNAVGYPYPVRVRAFFCSILYFITLPPSNETLMDRREKAFSTAPPPRACEGVMPWNVRNALVKLSGLS